MVVLTVVPAERFAPLESGDLTVPRTAVRHVDPHHRGTAPDSGRTRPDTAADRGQAQDSDDTKSERGRRLLALDPITVEGLRAQCDCQDEERSAFGTGYGETGLVFTWEDWWPAHPDVIRQRFNPAGDPTQAPADPIARPASQLRVCRALGLCSSEAGQRATGACVIRLHAHAVLARAPRSRPGGGQHGGRSDAGADNDTWIAARCISHDVPLATANVRHFADFAEHHGLILAAD